MLKNPWALWLLKGHHRRAQIFPIAQIFRRSQRNGSFPLFGGDHREEKKFISTPNDV